MRNKGNLFFIVLFFGSSLVQRMNLLIRFIIKPKGGNSMDQKYNTGDDAAIELKKALNKSQPRSNPNMSEAEQKLKFPNKKS